MSAQSLSYRHSFPEHIVLEGCGMILIEDEFIDCVWKGDSVLGWEGENNLAVYLDIEGGSWNLLRYCPDNEGDAYRVIARFAALIIPTASIPGAMVMWLVEHDSRRGFTPDTVFAHNDAVEAAIEKELETYAVEELSPRYQRAVLKEL